VITLDFPITHPSSLCFPHLQSNNKALPFLTAPHDAVREGLNTLKDDAVSTHPVETIQKAHAPPTTSQTRVQMLRNVYGSALPMKMLMEEQMLNRIERPGFPSSKLGMEVLSGRLDDFGFESFLGLPDDSEVPPPDVHSEMEKKLGMGSTTKPMSRGMV